MAVNYQPVWLRPAGSNVVNGCRGTIDPAPAHVREIAMIILREVRVPAPPQGPVAQGHAFLYKGAKSRVRDGQ
jgi:hypothetical protein